MGLGFAGIGSFAGGLATGIQQGQRMHHDMDRQKRAKEEDERKKGLRLAGANTFGNVGTDREDGSVYTEDDAVQDYKAQSAPYDDNPLGTRAAAGQLKASGLQAKAAGLQIQGLERQEREAQLGEQSMALLRDWSAGGDPMDVYRRAMQLYGKVPDGKHASLAEDPAGNLMMVLTDTNTGQSRLAQFNHENVGKALKGLHALTSQKTLQQAQEHGIKQRTADQGDRRLGILQQQVDNQGRLIDAQSEAYRALAGQREQTGLNKMPEPDKIMLTGVGNRLKNIDVLLSKVDMNDPNAPQQLAQLKQQQRVLLSQEYSLLKKHGLVVPGTTLSAYRGLPDPMQMVMTAINSAGTEAEFMKSASSLEQLYGDDPDAADAMNAIADLRRDKFSRVRPQNETTLSRVASGLGSLAHHMTHEPDALPRAGLPLFNQQPAYGAQQQAPKGLAQQPRGQEVKGLIRR